MHVCNLGLVHAASGGALCPSLFKMYFLAFVFNLEWKFCYYTFVCCDLIFFYMLPPREALLREQHFGPYAGPADMKTCLETAFNEFQSWLRQHSISCSQRSFAPRHLLKQVHGYYLTTKAYNARIVLLWLAFKCEQVAQNVPATSHIPLHATALQLC